MDEEPVWPGRAGERRIPKVEQGKLLCERQKRSADGHGPVIHLEVWGRARPTISGFGVWGCDVEFPVPVLYRLRVVGCEWRSRQRRPVTPGNAVRSSPSLLLQADLARRALVASGTLDLRSVF